jgi:hypothetical protein
LENNGTNQGKFMLGCSKVFITDYIQLSLSSHCYGANIVS